MQEHMLKHVQSRQNAIYRRANACVMEHLGNIFEANREELKETAHSIVDNLETDFRSMISSSKKIEAVEIARGHVRDLLHNADAKFMALESTESTQVSGAQRPESEPQQASAAGMDDVNDEADETSEAKDSLETGAMDTAL